MVGPPRGKRAPMDQKLVHRGPSRSQMLAQRALLTSERFTRIGTASGIAPFFAAAIVLIWASSLFADSYRHLLAFENESLLAAAKLGVLLGSLIAAAIGLVWGEAHVRLKRCAEIPDLAAKAH